MKIIKFSFLVFLILNFFSIIYSIDVCGVSMSTSNSFIIKDSFDNNILVIDPSGNVFMQGESHTDTTTNSFKTGANEFSYAISKTSFNDNSQELTTLSSASALIIENSQGSAVTKLFETGYLETKGKIIAEGSQANCNADGWGYCNGDGLTRESRDYSCDITGKESGACIYSVSNIEDCSTKLSEDSDGSSFNLGGFVTDYTGCDSGNCVSNIYNDYCSGDNVVDRRASGSSITSSSYNCNELDYNDCSGSNRRSVDYTCGGASCTSSSTIVETCIAPPTNYGTWSCSDTSTSQRLVTSYSPSCNIAGSNSFCGSTSGSSTQTTSCSTSNVCRPTSGCSPATFSWKTTNYGSCSVSCGSGSKTRSVWCEREDGLSVSDSYCGGGKPKTSTYCSQYPSNYGSSCTNSDSCGTNYGSYVCNWAKTGTSCSAATANFKPWNYGNSCTSGSNSCGMRNSGSITCSGSCNAYTPSNSACPETRWYVNHAGTYKGSLTTAPTPETLVLTVSSTGQVTGLATEYYYQLTGYDCRYWQVINPNFSVKVMPSASSASSCVSNNLVATRAQMGPISTLISPQTDVSGSVSASGHFTGIWTGKSGGSGSITGVGASNGRSMTIRFINSHNNYMTTTVYR